jgi:mannose-6-phosphate isomerase
MAYLLECSTMPYAWGSRTAIAELTGRPGPTASPEAELWMGAHPVAPSRVADGGERRSLIDVIAASPIEILGEETARTFGPRLPFLLKVLAADEPLSLQAHPTEAQARAGFEEEERRRVARDAPTRNYKDASHKPELLCALTPFDALCGFRRAADTVRLLDALGVAELEPFVLPLRASPDARGLSQTFQALMTSDVGDRARVVAATVRACQEEDASAPYPRERALARRLGALYPGDVGVVSALLLNLVHLEPGEAIYLGAGNLHAYLGGVGVEIMASSDNVLRGGLTPKHVDVPELLQVLDFADGPIDVVRPTPAGPNEEIYETPAREFSLSRVRVQGGSATLEVRGPEILLVTDGALSLAGPAGRLHLPKGAAAFVPAEEQRLTLGGTGTAYRATVPTRPRP